MSKYRSKLSEEVEKYADLIDSAYMLCVDPSSGSASSLPGYAVFEAGKLTDLGVIELPRGTRAVHNRLFLLADTLRSSFDKPDILVCELISPVMPVGQGRFAQAKGAGQLMKAVGAILSIWDVPVLEPAPATWRTMIPPGYVKTDASDAAMLGNAVYTTLARLRGMPDPAIQLPAEFIDAALAAKVDAQTKKKKGAK